MMRKDLRIVMVAVAWAFATACNGCFGCAPPTERPGSTLPTACDEMSPDIEPQQLDVLFVIDNSGSMREEQEGVARELGSFVSQLRTAGGIAQDIRVGVITTTVYQHTNTNGVKFFADCSRGIYCTQMGKLQPVPDQGPDGGILLGTGSIRVLDSNVEEAEFLPRFTRLVQQGTTGSGQETPFEALRMALFGWNTATVANGGNGGFLRDGARLLIVTLTDEDDCSEREIRPSVVTIGSLPSVDYCGQQSNQLTPVTEYYDIFKGLKNSDGSAKGIVYATIGPVGISNKQVQEVMDTVTTADGGMYQQVRNIDCPTSIEPGFRHKKMAELFDTRLENIDSICKPDYRETLIKIAVLAGVDQTLSIRGVPDPRTLSLIIERADKSKQPCTMDNGGFTWEEPFMGADGGIQPGRATFGPSCLRRRDDLSLKIDRLCLL